MAKFEVRDNELFIDGKRVIKAWESFSGWYWFAVERAYEQVSEINGQTIQDTIWFGFVQGFEEEWGYFSEAELKTCVNMVWEIPKENLPYSGRRSR